MRPPRVVRRPAAAARRRLDQAAKRHESVAVAMAAAQRFGEIDGRSRVAAICLDVFIALVPLVIVLTAYLQPETHLNSFGDVVARAFTLHGHTANVIYHAFPSSAQLRRDASLLAVGGFVVAGFDLTNALQSTYDRAWGCESLTGMRAGLRGLLWIGMAVVFAAFLSLVGAVAGTAGWGRTSAVVAATIPASMVFWLITPGLLLSRRIGWRPLLPGAVAGTIGLLGLQGASWWFMPSTIKEYADLFGALGVSIALLVWVWAISLIWVVAAVLTAVLFERRTGRMASEWPVRRIARKPRGSHPQSRRRRRHRAGHH